MRHAGGVADLQPVGEELVPRGQNPHCLLQRALPDLDHRADLPALLVEHGVFVRHFNELGLLVDDEHRLAEQRPTARPDGGYPGQLAHLLLHLVRGVFGPYWLGHHALRRTPARPTRTTRLPGVLTLTGIRDPATLAGIRALTAFTGVLTTLAGIRHLPGA
ncbi:hypothetical protein FAIPA1_190033 [Frankia sp. AiPs1]